MVVSKQPHDASIGQANPNKEDLSGVITSIVRLVGSIFVEYYRVNALDIIFPEIDSHVINSSIARVTNVDIKIS